MYEWKVSRNVSCYQIYRQTRPLRLGEPMHSGVRETRGPYATEEEAQAAADELNAKRR
ncbi:hypothetical protein [Clostridium sp. AM29-11AC]|uniref:hypothetical protein n=1 Tax=Clostridium sp. AM29-11AC TaxID=2293028 RepID=UPI0015FA44B9|nr:hypothetical protein [Clostridium sp. AM29-11AC]